MKKTLAIIAPNNNAYSETFIQAHKQLPFHIKFYYGGWMPSILEGQGKIAHFGFADKIRMKFSAPFTWNELALFNSLKKEKAEVVLAEFGPTACEVLKVVQALRLPMIVHFFGFDACKTDTIREYGDRYKLVFAYAKHVVVVSKKMRSDLIRIGCPAEKITLSYCGPSEIFYDIKPHFQNQHFLAIGRFVDKKAPYLTIAAFKNVLANFPDARLIMLGDGVLLNTCKNLVHLWQIEKNIDFAGIKTPAEILDLFENALCFVQHSIMVDDGDSEGTPVAVLDAQAAALPVISTAHAGIADVVSMNETGFLVEEQDVESMANAMLRLLEEKGLAFKMGAAGRDRVKTHFSLKLHLNTLQGLIENT